MNCEDSVNDSKIGGTGMVLDRLAKILLGVAVVFIVVGIVYWFVK